MGRCFRISCCFCGLFILSNIKDFIDHLNSFKKKTGSGHDFVILLLCMKNVAKPKTVLQHSSSFLSCEIKPNVILSLEKESWID